MIFIIFFYIFVKNKIKNMNALKQIMEIANARAIDIYPKIGVKQATFSKRLKGDVKGSIEWSIEVARELGVKKYTIYQDNCIIKIQLL